MNKAEELCHSSGPWKKHKYFQKIGEGANAVYRYAKNDAAHDAKQFYRKNITGDEYKAREWAAKENSKNDQSYAEQAIKEGRIHAANNALKSAERYGKKAAQAEHDYKAKSLKGVTESAISRGQAKINKLFKSETKVTVKDTFTGKTRTPSKPTSAADTINIKQASEKNKKRKK